MPPKKRQKATIRSEYIDSLPDNETDQVTTPSLISRDQLARAYGLAPPRKNASPQTIDLLTGCKPKWGGEGTSGTSTKMMKPTKEVLELDTSDDDISIQSTSTKGKQAAKGKGKGKQVIDDTFKPRLCSSENCKENPKCLNWLGQDKWENSSKAWKDYRKSMGLPPDPENDRVPDIPVGLRNLGATCYVNSFLQVWYRDARFRAGVYSCEPPANGNVESSPLFQLQVLFSFLQTSSQAIYNPTPLVNSLKLDQTEQQDAQEFSKLFLSLLDHEFKKQSLRKEQEGSGMNVGKLVQEQFEGKMTYGTRCKTCRHASERPASFLELEVSLAKDCKLEDRIRQSLRDEQLTGDNQYHCEQCDGKRDATRYSELQSLPPVLHFSLLRFTFNLKDFSRAKSQHAISYPLSLDMGKHLPSNPQTGEKDEVWYDLKGVLMHKGLSAHHGHYVAQVYDEQQSKWFLFDDESVEPVEDLNAPLIYDEDDDPVVAGKKKPTTKKVAVGAKAKGFTRDENGQVLPKSKDAYMLVYTRRPDPSQPKPAEPNPPPLARFEVDKIDDVYKKEVEDWKQTSGNAKEAFEKLREQKRSVYRSWDVTDEDEEAFLVDKIPLRRWVESGLKATSNSKTDVKGKGRATDEDMEDVKIIEAPTNGAQNREVEMNEASGSKSTSPSASTSRKDSPSVSTSGPPLSPRKEDSLTPPPSTSDEEKKEKPKIELVKWISNASVICPHGHANPLRATQMKRVSQTAYMTLKELDVDIEPELMTRRDLCRECVAGMATECYYHESHASLVKKVQAREKASTGDTCQISKAWITDWLKSAPKMHSTLTGTDPSPASHPFIDDVLCEHGGLAADVKKRRMISLEAAKILQGEFPDFKIQDPRPCHVCEGTLEMDAAQSKELKDIQAKEKKLIKSFDGQSRLSGTRLPLSDNDNSHFVVPKDWSRQWASWVTKTKSPPPRPPPLSNSSFLCKHSLLCLDLPKEVETAKTIAIATPDEWKYLKKEYDAGPEIRVWIEQGETQPKSYPQVCKECLDIKRKNFVTTDVWIKILEDSDLDEHGQRRFVDTSPQPDRSSPQTSRPIKNATGQSVNHFYGSAGQRATRTSARHKGTMVNKKSLKHIEIEKSDKVKDLKPKIEEATGIPSISQRIFFNLQELEGSQSVEELSIIGDDVIEVYQVVQDEDIDLDELQDVDVSKTTRSNGKKRVREEGFGGTGLFGWDTGGEQNGGGGNGGIEEEVEEEEGNVSKRSRRSSKSTTETGQEQQAMEVEPIAHGTWQEQDEATIPCPECTFLNNNALTECEMCSTKLAG